MNRKGQFGALVVLLATIAAFAAPSASPAIKRNGVVRTARVAHVTLSLLETGVLDQLNAIRIQNNLVPLKLSPGLTASADAHTQEMAATGYFAHASLDGTAFWQRINHWYPASSYSYWSVGENLLWSSPDVDPSSALALWMDSPEHRANILDPTWRDIGIAAVHMDSAPGIFQGVPVTIITTDFGVRH